MGIRCEINDGIAEIVMDNPPVNALAVQGWFDLAKIVTEAGRNPEVRVVLLAAEGKGFNAGVDIKEMQRSEGFELAPRGYLPRDLIQHAADHTAEQRRPHCTTAESRQSGRSRIV